MSFPLSAMFDEMLEEVKVDWSESESGRARLAGAGGAPVSPQSGRGAGPIPQPSQTRHGGNCNQLLKSSSQLPLQCNAAFSLFLGASPIFHSYLNFYNRLDTILRINSERLVFIRGMNHISHSRADQISGSGVPPHVTLTPS